MMVPLRDQVTILQAATAVTEDSHGNPTVDWSTATQSVSTAAVTPASRMGGSEDTAGQDTVVSRMQLFLPPGASLTFRDRVVWRGDLFEVDGDVDLHTDRSARPHHKEAFLRRVQG